MKNFKKILAIGIPLILISYLFYSNFLVSKDFNHSYDIGSETDNYLNPTNRISDKFSESDINYRNAVGHLVYFDVPIPYGSDSVKVTARIKDNFPNNEKFAFGARNTYPFWGYKYNFVFDKSQSPETTGQWVLVETTYDLKEDDLIFNNGELNMFLNMEHLNPERTETNIYYIPIDWINVTVHKEGWLW